MESRKVIQISFALHQGGALVALCDDGSMWILERPWDGASQWERVKDIPEAKEAEGGE